MCINKRLVINNSTDIIAGGVISDDRFTIQDSTDISNLYSSYTVIGNGTNVSSTVKNSEVKRYRPKIIIADTKVNKKSAQNMAEWEKQKAVGNHITTSVSGSGWSDDEGNLFDINKLSPLESKRLNISKNVLIKSVTYQYNSSGEKIQMSLVDKNTYA